jgi:hypothetical protein
MWGDSNMKLLRTSIILAGATGALLLPATGPAARNIKAKPDPAVCAEARSRGQILPGCPKPDADELDRRSGSGPGPDQQPTGTPADSSSRDDVGGELDDAREGFMICPGNPRCPK